MTRFSRNVPAPEPAFEVERSYERDRIRALLPPRDEAAEDGLLRAWARILREAASAERAARPSLRIVRRSGRRRAVEGD